MKIIFIELSKVLYLLMIPGLVHNQSVLDDGGDLRHALLELVQLGREVRAEPARHGALSAITLQWNNGR